MRAARRRTAVVRAPADDRGTVTAEFAIVLPVLLLVLGLAVGAIMLQTHRLVLTSASFEIARLEARGEQGAAAAHLEHLGQVEVVRQRDGPLWCVTLRSAPRSGLLSIVTVSATGCAAVSA